MLKSMLLFQMKWTECLHGAGSLRDCLADLSDMFDARVVHLHRICTETGRQRTIASLDREAREGARPLIRAVGPGILAPAQSRARPGTVWMLTEDQDVLRPDDRVVCWLKDRRLRDVAAIPLGLSGTEIDLLELYLPVSLSPVMRRTLEATASAAAAAWERREKGRIARILTSASAVSERLAQKIVPDRVSPLSPANPLNLTAAEMRICTLFRGGASTREIAVVLQISESTMRTHLRNIYAKTGVCGQVELVRVLLGEPETPQHRIVG
jgi:DNA-binding CsgD family transcriptional regulator